MIQKRKPKFWIGIDEVGRGALAGPVVVAALCLPFGFNLKRLESGMGELRDSKRLTPIARRRWFHCLKSQTGIKYSLGWVTARVIDKINIRMAANLAGRRACVRLISKLGRENIGDFRIITDGGLSVGSDIPHREVIGGDENYAAIKMASIMAKVSRDDAMTRRHLKYPYYGFFEHKGYGTKVHRVAISEHGPSPIHRRSFIGNIKIALRRGD